MCCFTGEVSVSKTSIFARDAGTGRQFVVYAMSVQAKQEVAMVLPLPVAKWAGEKGLTFIDLSGYATFFNDLSALFITRSLKAVPEVYAAAPAPEPIAVQQIGSFEASFVPTPADFARLDPRFQLPTSFWDKLPQYRDFGFAVFKLKPGQLEHPMALSFQREDPATLFFPTVHVHDGMVHEKAHFDHTLYTQLGPFHAANFQAWTESPGHPQGSSFDLKRSGDLVAGNQHVYRLTLAGDLPNQDTVLTLS